MKQNNIDKKYRQLNDFIRGEMRRKKVNQETLANWLNLTQASISQKLSGKVEWMAREIISIFELLEIQDEWKW